MTNEQMDNLAKENFKNILENAEKQQTWHGLRECKKTQERQNLASEIICAMIRVPENRNVDFDTLSDFAVRQADSLIKKLNEPEI
jgi:hypothetical protein